MNEVLEGLMEEQGIKDVDELAMVASAETDGVYPVEEIRAALEDPEKLGADIYVILKDVFGLDSERDRERLDALLRAWCAEIRQARMNKAGAILAGMMEKRGIDGVKELSDRMKELMVERPELYTRHASVVRIRKFMEEDVAEMPGFHPHFFQCLQAVLKPSDDEYKSLLWAHFAKGEPLSSTSSRA